MADPGPGRVLLAKVIAEAQELRLLLGELAELGIHLGNADRHGLGLLVADAERELDGDG